MASVISLTTFLRAEEGVKPASGAEVRAFDAVTVTAAAPKKSTLRKPADAGSRVFASNVMPDFLPAEPESHYTIDRERMVSAFARADDPGLEKLPTIDFCSEWNPEFSFNGHRCCRSLASVHSRKQRVSCFSHRPRGNYCDEMTDDQRRYQESLLTGHSDDVLALITRDMGRRDQAYCTPNNGFLAEGRPVVPSSLNRLQLRSPERCTQFGTDNMVGMLEWVGREIALKYPAPEYSGVRLLLGDIAAPRGGCLSGFSGRHGHLSHTNGSDADIGLLTARSNSRSPSSFNNSFDARENWWLIKALMKNPYGCVKVIFLDKRHIKKLAKFARSDEEWSQFGRFIRHQKGHRNHMHVRIGDHPGRPGCSAGAHPELEEEYDAEEAEADTDAEGDAVSAQMAHPVDVPEAE